MRVSGPRTGRALREAPPRSSSTPDPDPLLRTMSIQRLASALLGLLLLAALGIGSLGLVSGNQVTGPPRSYSVVEEAGPAEPAPAPASPTASTAAPARLDDGAQARVSVDPATLDVRWIEGRVELPAGSPFDDSLCVVALGAPRASDPKARDVEPGDRSWHRREVLGRAPVAADGTFRAAVPRDLDLAGDEPALDVDGRYLFLPEPQALDAAVLDGGAVVLEPELGGAILVRLRLPPGTSEAPASVHAGAFGMHFAGAGMSREQAFADTLELELRALQPDLRYKVWANADVHPGAMHDGELLVRAGERVEAPIVLARGATVRGVVVGPSGDPVAGADVLGHAGGSYGIHPAAGKARTDELGHFELRGLDARSQTIHVRADEHLDGASDELELADGAVVRDLRIVLDPGQQLAGRVQWPDGSAAAGARITVAPLDPSGIAWHHLEKARSPEGSTRSASDGAFRARGLRPGAYALYAELESEAAGGARWSARVTSVEAPSTDLVLTLALPAPHAGRVLDDGGGEVEAFTVTARRADWPTWMQGPSAQVERTFEDAAGRFELDVDPGEWRLSVRAEGHLAGEDRTVQAPGEDPEPFVLTRTARLAGTVLDPNGLPVADAEVRVAAESPEGRNGVERTDAEGRFVFGSVGPGPLALEATSSAWAPSGEQRLDSLPGDELAGRTLALTRGGSVAGIVHDVTGAPDVGRTIVAQSERGDVREALSDAGGRFRFDHLAPGRHQVIATPEPEAWESDSDETDLGVLFDEMRMALVTVVEDETVEVVLGAPPSNPVVVHGRVSRGGEGLARAGLLVVPENGGFFEGLRADTAGEDGDFEVRLDEPGDYTFVVLASQDVESEVDFQVTVPAVPRYALDLELPAGSISGRVRAPDGSAPHHALVWIRREDGTSDLSALMGLASASVDEDGSFRVETLHPGRYTLSASGPEAAMTSLHDVVVRAGEPTSGVELLLAEAGRLAGTVTDASGAGVAEATVLLRDGRGRPLHQLSATTDRHGAFAIERVPAGDVFVVARTADRVSLDAPPVRVPAGGEARAELALRSGVVLHVALEDAEGEPDRAAIRVESEAGHDRVGGATRDELERLATEGVSASRRRVGPLPPGRYTVRATTPDGRAAEETVTLLPGPGGELGEAQVILRLHD